MCGKRSMGVISEFMVPVIEPGFSAYLAIVCSLGPDSNASISSDDVIQAAWDAGVGVYALIWVISFSSAFPLPSHSSISHSSVSTGRTSTRLVAIHSFPSFTPTHWLPMSSVPSNSALNPSLIMYLRPLSLLLRYVKQKRS